MWIRRVQAGEFQLGREGGGKSKSSLPVYTGGINGKLQEKTECVCTFLRPEGLRLVCTRLHTHTHASRLSFASVIHSDVCTPLIIEVHTDLT